VLQSATGPSSRQIIHQSGGSSLSIASSSPTPVVIARKSTATPTSVVLPTTTGPSTSISNSGQARSRKQVLIPVDILSRLEEQDTHSDKKVMDPEIRAKDSDNDATESDDDSSVAKRIKRRRTSSTTTATVDSETTELKSLSENEGKKSTETTEKNASLGIIPVALDSEMLSSAEFEQDILEEDFDDLEYVPYTSRKPKNKRGGSNSKGRLAK
jgi:hypothetical protein